MRRTKTATKNIRNRISNIEPMERRILFTTAPISLDPTFKVSGETPVQAAAGFATLTACNPVNGDVFVIGYPANADSIASDYEVQRYTSAGAIVTAFGNNGLVTSVMQANPVAAVVQSDGKILVLATVDGSYNQLYLTRYTLSGSVDPSFGTGGSVEMPFSGTTFDANANYSKISLSLLSNGDIIIPGAFTAGTTNESALTALTASGSPDKSFGTNGVATGVAGYLNAVTTDASGNLIAVGYAPATASTSSLGDGLVERFTAAGKLDKSFGSNGATVSTNATEFFAVQTLGTGVAATGWFESVPNAGEPTYALELNHYTSSGDLDTTFASGKGYVSPKLDFTFNSYPTFQADGKLLVNGYYGPSYDIENDGLARLNSDGTLDTIFGIAGYDDFNTGPTGGPVVGSLSLEPNGGIVMPSLPSNAGTLPGLDFDPVRLLHNGAYDTSFGPGGMAVGRPLFTAGSAVAELPNGQTLVAGTVTVGGETGSYIQRYNNNGSVDNTFAPDEGFSGQSGYLFLGPGVSIQTGNGVSVAGLSDNSAGQIYVSEFGVGILRFNSNGVLDRTYGTGGIAANNQSGQFLLEANGQILEVTGISTLTRLNASGLVDTTFGSAGTVTLPTTFDQSLGALAVQPDGKILVGGSILASTNSNDLAVIRLTTSGSVDSTFGTQGIAVADKLPEENNLYFRLSYDADVWGISVLPNGIIVAAGTASQSAGFGASVSGPTIAEFLPSGQLNPAFATGGQTPMYSSTTGRYNNVIGFTAETDGTLVVAGTQTYGIPTTDSSVFVLSYSANGTPGSFVTTQFVTTNPNQLGEDNVAQAAVAGPNETLLVTGFTVPFSNQNAALLARYVVEGSGSVSGTVYSDYTGNATNFKTPVAGQIVYADLNNDSKLDPGEPSAITNAQGKYTLTGVPDGAVILREVLTQDRQSYPSGGSGEHVTVGPTPVSNVNFAVTVDLYVSGTVLTSTFAPAAGVQVYADLNHDGKYEIGEPVTTTASNGSFDFESLSAGTYTFRIVPPPKYIQTTPINSTGITLSLAKGGVDTHLAFTITPLNTKAFAGTLIGTTGSYQNQGNSIANVFDGNLSSFFDAPTASGAWVGLDLGSAKVVTEVQFAPRDSNWSGFAQRMVGGEIQASNSADFSSGVVTLFTITAPPTAGVLTTESLNNTTAYRYYRYIGPTDGWCNIAVLEFQG